MFVISSPDEFLVYYLTCNRLYLSEEEQYCVLVSCSCTIWSYLQ